MPAFAGQDERMATAAIHRFSGLRHRLLQHLGLDAAPFQIMFFQFLRDTLGNDFRVGGQEFDDFDTVIDSSSRVDARPQAKANLAGGNVASGDSRHFFLAR